MKKDFNCTCNKCGNEFKPEFKVEIVDSEKDIRITYFKCPNCNFKYFSGATDKEYESMLTEYKKIMASVGNALKNGATPAVIQALNKRASNYEIALNAYYELLREQWINYFME